MRPSTPPLVLLLTEDRFSADESTDWYIAQILEEDRLLRLALECLGARVRRLAWSDPDFDWTSAQLAMFRTTWDYSSRFQEFFTWLDRTSQMTRLINPVEVIRWNLDKRYLREMQSRGVRIPPTAFFERGSRVDLEGILASNGWNEAIVKPAVSGGARNTFRISSEGSRTFAPEFNRILEQESMLVQEFQTDILSEGELSLIVIGGTFTHAIRKIAKPGDFRVQDDHGGTVHSHDATPEEIAFAERAISVCPAHPVYARVDIMRNNNGELALMELELIEPELFLRFSPSAAQRLAEELIRHS